jgi:2-amino-4-hydroxy-6-hydroxymethyldihydropteridine diphosphokinase
MIYDKVIYLSDMTIHGWKTRFKEIRKKFGYSEKDDYLSAKKLDSLLEKKFPKKQLQDIIDGKTVFIIGAGPSLSKSLTYVKKCKNVTKIVADGAVRALLEKNIRPDILVTDLDGDLDSIKKIGQTEIPIIVHAHGDNYDKLEIVKKLSNVVGSTQTKTFGKMENFGGFTDGDRCVFLAEYFNATKIVLIGMDFGQKIGKYSKHKIINRKMKLKKLKVGKSIIEWFGTKSKADLYSTKKIKGYKTIRLIDLECIENF